MFRQEHVGVVLDHLQASITRILWKLGLISVDYCDVMDSYFGESTPAAVFVHMKCGPLIWHMYNCWFCDWLITKEGKRRLALLDNDIFKED